MTLDFLQRLTITAKAANEGKAEGNSIKIAVAGDPGAMQPFASLLGMRMAQIKASEHPQNNSGKGPLTLRQIATNSTNLGESKGIDMSAGIGLGYSGDFAADLAEAAPAPNDSHSNLFPSSPALAEYLLASVPLDDGQMAEAVPQLFVSPSDLNDLVIATRNGNQELLHEFLYDSPELRAEIDQILQILQQAPDVRDSREASEAQTHADNTARLSPVLLAVADTPGDSVARLFSALRISLPGAQYLLNLGPVEAAVAAKLIGKPVVASQLQNFLPIAVKAEAAAGNLPDETVTPPVSPDGSADMQSTDAANTDAIEFLEALFSDDELPATAAPGGETATLAKSKSADSDDANISTKASAPETAAKTPPAQAPSAAATAARAASPESTVAAPQQAVAASQQQTGLFAAKSAQITADDDEQSPASPIGLFREPKERRTWREQDAVPIAPQESLAYFSAVNRPGAESTTLAETAGGSRVTGDNFSLAQQELRIEVFKISSGQSEARNGQAFLSARNVTATLAQQTVVNNQTFVELSRFAQNWRQALGTSFREANLVADTVESPDLNMGSAGENLPTDTGKPILTSALPAAQVVPETDTSQNAGQTKEAAAKSTSNASTHGKSTTPEAQPLVRPESTTVAADRQTPTKNVAESGRFRLVEEQVARFENIRQQIARNLTSDTTEVRLKLHPEHLGSIQLRLELRNGAMQANFLVESLETKALLDTGMDSLRQTLHDHGIQASRIDVQVAPAVTAPVRPDGHQQDFWRDPEHEPQHKDEQRPQQRQRQRQKQDQEPNLFDKYL